jgi:putative SOS response-associated peptidase YedK
MISRYALYDIAGLSKRFLANAGLPKGIKPHYNISPTIKAPVIVSENGAPVAKLMQWGLLPKGAKDTNSVFRYKTFIIPSEDVFSKHSWQLAVRESRCLVPANGFYELNEGGEKRAFYGEMKDKALVAFAGVYNTWKDDEGIEHSTYSILTTEPSADMPDRRMRMPILVSPEDEARWLDPSVSDDSSIYMMLRPNPSYLLNVYEVSPDVHSPKPNQPSLTDRI